MSVNANRVVVIGGGIGGLCSAIALRQRGFDVAVFEQAQVLNVVGAGLTLWANAIKALRHLGLADRVIKAGSRIRIAKLKTSSGRVLTGSEPGELEQRFGEPTVAIHRADLHEILLSALPKGTVSLNAKCSAIEQDDNGVTIRFASGSQERADLVIGADGIHSVARAQLFPEVNLRYSGYTAWRGVVETGNESALGTTTESWGRGSRFGILRIDKTRVYWFATANRPAGIKESPALVKQGLLERFRGWHSPIELLIERTPVGQILQNDIYDIRPMGTWSRGRVTLLGDAAHPTTPNMGQGACMAIESSVVLARALAEENDIASAFRRYELERMPRTSWITEQSWKIGSIGQWENPIACAVRNALVAVTPDSVTKKQLERAAGFKV